MLLGRDFQNDWILISTDLQLMEESPYWLGDVKEESGEKYHPNHTLYSPMLS